MARRVNSDNLRETRFENRQLEALGIEVMNLDRLRQKLPRETFYQPERVDFFMLIHVLAGKGSHWVDFVEFPLGPGSLIVVRPGQVQRWQADGSYSATLVLIDPAALPYWGELSSAREGDLLALLDWQTVCRLPPDLSTDIGSTLTRLTRDIAAFDGSTLEIFLIRHEFLVLMLRLARWQQHLTSGQRAQGRQLATYRMFIQELETAFQREHRLAYYAKRLGYSQSTLSRACSAAEGRPAKTVIDRRIVLEAQRILVHSSASVAEIGHQLGFSEPTNFVKFFRRIVGTTPADFRTQRLGR